MEKQRRSRQNPEIRKFILDNVEMHGKNITALAVNKFGITRAAINNYLVRLIEEGLLEAEGRTSSRVYKLKDFVHVIFDDRLMDGISEDVTWRYKVFPNIKNVRQNVIDICQYGFTEMLNNAIDHSASFNAVICYSQNYKRIQMRIIDHGIGIFEKIQKDFNLEDPRSALLELSKGKITSAPTRHAGEGIFFTSRMFDKFTILSGYLFYSRIRQEGDEWLIESIEEDKYSKGTSVCMEIRADADWTTREVFNKYQNDAVGFRRTHVPIKLGKYPGEQLVSRSQAKRILTRFDKFSEVMLDFSGIQNIGQPFADEIFRVFKLDHPDINIYAIHANSDIKNMISHVTSSGDSKDQMELFLK